MFFELFPPILANVRNGLEKRTCTDHKGDKQHDAFDDHVPVRHVKRWKLCKILKHTIKGVWKTFELEFERKSDSVLHELLSLGAREPGDGYCAFAKLPTHIRSGRGTGRSTGREIPFTGRTKSNVVIL